MTTTETPLDQAKLDAFVGRFLGDLGTAMHLPTVLIGDRLGLYWAMADGEPVTAAALADRTGTTERYVTEWLAAQAAAEYVDDDAGSGTFRLPPEHAALLIDQGAPVFIPGAFQLAAASVKDEPQVTEAFRTGEGVGSSGTKTSSTTKSWLPVPRMPDTDQVSVISTSSRGNTIIRTGGSRPSSTTQCARNQWQWSQPLANDHRPVTRNPPSAGVAVPVGLKAPPRMTSGPSA